MQKLTRAEAASWLKAHDRFVIVTHCGPDGDTLGSAAALCLGLRQLGKKAWVLDNPQVQEKYACLLEGLTKQEAEAEDRVICVDVAAPHMLSDSNLEQRLSLRIDHHGSATPFGQLELVDSTAAACGEIIYDLLMLLQVQLSVAMANALFTAVSTDTGCFRYANTTGSTFRVAAACKDVSPDITDITRELFDTVTLGRLKLQGWVVENTRFLLEGQVAICAMPGDLQEKLGLTQADMENISGFPRSIQGVKMAATLRQEDDTVKLSVRAVPGWDAAAVCEKFGGGGHKGAAGAGLNMPLEQAAQAVERAIIEERK